MKPAAKKIALERIQLLIDNAIINAKNDPKLSQRQASLARRISSRHKIQIPYYLKLIFCKKCKSFIVPGINSKIRIGRTSVKSIRISCNFCGHTYRKIITNHILDKKIE